MDARSKALISNLFDRELELMAALPTDDPLDTKRRRRVELTLPEIEEQPQVIRTTLERERGNIAAAADRVAKSGIKRIYMTGCGDSLACMVAVRSLYEELFGIPCEPVQALDMAYYYHHTLGPDALVITLSSSGTTTRTVEAMMIAKAKGAQTLALSNTPGSALMVESDHQLTIHATRKGWPTQASTAAIALLCQFALDVAKASGRAPSRVATLQAALDAIPDQIAEVITTHNAAIAEIAAREAARTVYLYAAGGPSYAAAMFGTAKVKECTPDHGIAIPLEEFHHYNSQKAGDPLFLIAPAGPSVPRARDTAHEGKRWGGQVYAVVTGDEDMLDTHADVTLRLPAVPEVLSALVYTIPVQLFAYHVAMAKFRAAETALTA
ncbi:SIS domain-containing protein [Devosia psychrophila]|uniref:SIS domain-containing protein n=1 Tax=Devosia psychrophila TaxID=728005 RepID=UPI00069A1260|nr:SIS domain-containing protein [Devosia psychrophila]